MHFYDYFFKVRITVLDLLCLPLLFAHFSFCEAFENAQLLKNVSNAEFFLYLVVVIRQNMLIVTPSQTFETLTLTLFRTPHLHIKERNATTMPIDFLFLLHLVKPQLFDHLWLFFIVFSFSIVIIFSFGRLKHKASD